MIGSIKTIWQPEQLPEDCAWSTKGSFKEKFLESKEFSNKNLDFSWTCYALRMSNKQKYRLAKPSDSPSSSLGTTCLQQNNLSKNIFLKWINFQKNFNLKKSVLIRGRDPFTNCSGRLQLNSQIVRSTKWLFHKAISQYEQFLEY